MYAALAEGVPTGEHKGLPFLQVKRLIADVTLEERLIKIAVCVTSWRCGFDAVLHY